MLCQHEDNACPGGHADCPDQAHEARFRGASDAARSGADCGNAYSAAELQCMEVKNVFLRFRLWCSETSDQMRKFDDLCRHMTERHLS
eukprot:1247388-Pleurochrysis_carterae.AAC.1